MPPGGDQGFDRGQRPDFGQQIDPGQDDQGSGSDGFGDSDQDDSSTEG
jgi:hypothetical protein